MLSIVMPSHNEEAYLEAAVETTVGGLRERHIDFEILISENGSTDQTASKASGLAATYPEVRVLRSDVADYGLALRAGFLAAAGSVVVNFDVDMVDLDFVDRALPIVEAGADIVVGSKRADGADDQRSPARQAVTAVFSAVLRGGFGLRISDTHGLKALRRQPLVPLVKASRFNRDIFDTELIIRAQRAGLEIGEIPVTVAERRPPRTPIARRIPRTLAGLVKLRVSLWRERLS